MRPLPNKIIKILSPFAPVFSRRVWPQDQLLLVGPLLEPGKRTVRAVLAVLGLSQQPTFQTYHRVLNRYVWSPLAASHDPLARNAPSEIGRRIISSLYISFTL